MTKDLLNIILCPICNSKLFSDNNNLICINCNNEYIIKNNIPILLKEYI